MSAPLEDKNVAPERLVTVVIHDVAPRNLDACRRLIASVQRDGKLPITLLVVPRHLGERPDSTFERWLDEHARQGDELALHGYTHRDDGTPRSGVDRLRRRWYTAGEGEFAALDYAEAARRIDAGRRWFSANAWPLRGFVAPAWLMSPATRQVLVDRSFAYSATLTQLIRLPGQVFRSQSLVYSTRAAWRRQMSLLWARVVAARQQNAPLLRIELHPGDVEHAAIRDSWLAVLAAARKERVALTVADAVERLPDELWRLEPPARAPLDRGERAG